MNFVLHKSAQLWPQPFIHVNSCSRMYKIKLKIRVQKRVLSVVTKNPHSYLYLNRKPFILMHPCILIKLVGFWVQPDSWDMRLNIYRKMNWNISSHFKMKLSTFPKTFIYQSREKWLYFGLTSQGHQDHQKTIISKYF